MIICSVYNVTYHSFYVGITEQVVGVILLAAIARKSLGAGG